MTVVNLYPRLGRPGASFFRHVCHRLVDAVALFLFIPLVLISCASFATSERVDASFEGHPPREQVTFLMLSDRRSSPQADTARPDPTIGIPVTMPVEGFLDKGLDTWRQENWDVVLYNGPKPQTPDFTWSDFPLRGLTTDLGFGLDLKTIVLKEAGHNTWLAPHVLLDTLLLPLFAAGAMVSDGRFDLAARVFPSTTAAVIMDVELNVLSLKAGGLLFSKPYQARALAGRVYESTLQPNVRSGTGNTQELGQRLAALASENVFSEMTLDPELFRLPELANAVWLRRILAGPRLNASEKERLINKLADRTEIPCLTEEEIERLQALEPDDIQGATVVLERRPVLTGVADPPSPVLVNPKRLAETRAWMAVFKTMVTAMLEESGRLKAASMTAPPTADEKRLSATISNRLTSWGKNYAANRMYRTLFESGQLGRYEMEALFGILAGDLETLDNETYVRRELARLGDQMATGSETRRVEAAALIVAARGAGVLGDSRVVRPFLFQVLSGEDQWADHLVSAALEKGDFNPDTVRLAGAMALSRAVPMLLDLFKLVRLKESRRLWTSQGLTWQSAARELGIDPYDLPESTQIIRALGGFSENMEVRKAFREIIVTWRGIEENEVVAAAISCLGDMGDQEAMPIILDIWKKEWSAVHPASSVRRAALDALAKAADQEIWSVMLHDCRKQVERLSGLINYARPDPARNVTLLHEAADFFGRIRYAPAVDFLAGITCLEPGDRSLAQTAIRSLSLIATAEAYAVLKNMAGSDNMVLSGEAKTALDHLVVEQASEKELASLGVTARNIVRMASDS
jgi:hypothetical protein